MAHKSDDELQDALRALRGLPPKIRGKSATTIVVDDALPTFGPSSITFSGSGGSGTVQAEPLEGALRYNMRMNTVEYYKQGVWVSLGFREDVFKV